MLFDGSTFFKGLAARSSLKDARQHLANSEGSLRLAVAEAYVCCATAQVLEMLLLRRLEDQESLVKDLEQYVNSSLRSPIELNLASLVAVCS